MAVLGKNFWGAAGKYLYPDQVCASIYDIDLAELYASGVSGLILDIDNTLKPPGAKGFEKRVFDWLDAAREIGFDICLLSNSTRRRVMRFSSGLALLSITFAKKPASSGFRKAIRLMDSEAAKVCVVGDQIFTDVLGAKRLGLLAVYTRPISRKEGPTIMLKRILEHFILKNYYKMNKQGEN